MNNLINVKALLNSKREQGQTESCNIFFEKKENKKKEQEKQKGKLRSHKDNNGDVVTEKTKRFLKEIETIRVPSAAPPAKRPTPASEPPSPGPALLETVR